MRAFLYAALLALLFVQPAQAADINGGNGPGGGGSTQVTAGGGATTSRPISSYVTQVQDVRNFFAGTNASCATDVSPAVNAAVTAGVTRLWIPANCIYIPTSNAVPANLTIEGEDWQSTIIESSNFTVGSGVDLSLGAHSMLRNVMIKGLFCTVSANPFNTVKGCPLSEFKNVSDSSVTLANWAYENVMTLGPTSTPPGSGSAATDTPGLAITQKSTGGDGIYLQVGDAVGDNATGANGMRVVPAGSGDFGIYILPGLINTTTNQHYGVFCKELTDNVNGACFYVNRAGNGTDVTPSIRIDDQNATSAGQSNNVIQVSLTDQIAGNMLSMTQGTSAFTGNFIYLQSDTSGLGSFNSGNYIRIDNNGSYIAGITNSGEVRSNPGLDIGFKNNGSIVTSANFTLAQIQFAAGGDATVQSMVHEGCVANTSSAIVLTTAGGTNSCAASTSNCGNLSADNTLGVYSNIVVMAKDVTTHGTFVTYYLSTGTLIRNSGVGSSTWTTPATALTETAGTTTGYSITIAADLTNACPKITFTPPTSNTDTWYVQASFRVDEVKG